MTDETRTTALTLAVQLRLANSFNEGDEKTLERADAFERFLSDMPPAPSGEWQQKVPGGAFHPVGA